MQPLTEDWQRDYTRWQQRDLSKLEPVDGWADGIDVKAGLEPTMAGLPVLIAGLADGMKVVLAFESGHRESRRAVRRSFATCRRAGCAPT